MDKSPDAFRTISEVADFLDTPAHVLRFWETRFPQVRPVKRAGGRRYYRPSDIALLAGIKRLLHDDGLTIRGVQKILRDQGVRHVAALSGAPQDPADTIEAQLTAALGRGLTDADHAPSDEPPETAQIIALEAVLAEKEAARLATAPVHAPTAVQIDLFDLPVVPVAVPSDRPASVPDQAPAAQAPEMDTESDSSAIAAPMASRLRAQPKAALSDHLTAILPLRDRMVALRLRLSDGARKRPR